MRFKFPLAAAKNYFLGLATSGAVLFAGLFYFNAKKNAPQSPNGNSVEYLLSEKIPLQNFDPNALDENGWKNLGFSERQIATILKYKGIVGGSFSSKEQLQKCYSISAEKYGELQPYILLPENSVRYSGNYSPNRSFRNNSGFTPYHKKELRIHGKFNPDQFTAADFVQMGFSENQANSILKYKNYLGGSFQSKEKFKACFIISDDNYRKMEPYLLLPATAPENSSFSYKNIPSEKARTAYTSFDPNSTDLEGWRKLGFSEKQAQVIINYRDRNLRGSFKSLEDIQRCFVISPEKFQELKPFIILNTATNQNSVAPNNTERAESNKNQEQNTVTNFAAVDLNQITYKQLMEYGFDSKSAAMMLSFRKKLGGFVNRQQIIDTYDIDKALAQKLVAEAQLDISGVQKYNLLDAPEEWLKSHPYFKYSADKIIFYRITYPNEKKIWNMIKVKPEYEARMKLYLN
ncbi:helix-hairpin-helix domain-containing protein [Kaistella palustris]|uniref:helix-hairpin-helix domain-containing protein n=1 Tax=Kaistella palustris TaxID=493376 RepID=UPI00040D289F|nr:helix-hairpin-helix domain-containing protein [Kaistella palustris]